jgi:hypothetical protein
MREELPARSVPFVSLFLAMSSLPNTVHPNDSDVPEFPFALDPELERQVRASLESAASHAARVFGGGRRALPHDSTSVTSETVSSIPTASDEPQSRAYAS